MKNLVFLITVLVLVSCNKNENVWDSLTDEERTYLRDRAAQECLASTTDGFKEFKEKSNEQYNKFKRYQNWKYEYKKPDGVETKNISVWKVDALSVYFLMTSKSDGIEKYEFLKISDPTNQEMIDELKAQKCQRAFSYAKGSGTSVTTLEQVNQTSPTEKTKVVQTYTFHHNELAYFGIFHPEKKVEVYDKDDKLIPDRTEEFKGTLTAQETAKPTYPLWSEYKLYNPNNTKFCVVKFTDSDTGKTYPRPYTLDCSDNPLEGPEDFDPRTELCYLNTTNCTFPD